MLASSRRRAGRSDDGMTLVELLVSMILLTIVVGLATGALIVVLDKQSRVSQASDAAQQNQTAMELLSRVVRQGVYPTGSSTTSTIIQPNSSTNQLVVDSRLSSTQGASLTSLPSTSTQYTFYVSGSTLYWKKATVTCTAGSCTPGTNSTPKPLIRGVRNNSGPSVCPTNGSTDGPFHYVYLDANSSPVTVSAPTSAQLGTIAYVTVNLFTQTRTGPAKPSCTLLSDYIELRNKA
jgi:prepilin-type N-terminal cleavage/methylation domain-containing protein